MSKPSFKKDARPSGLAGVAFTVGADIKRKGKVIGRIHAPSRYNREDSYRCWVMVNVRQHENCDWSWHEVSKGHKSLDDAKASFVEDWPEVEKLPLREAE